MQTEIEALKEKAKMTTKREKAEKAARKRKHELTIGPIDGVIAFDGVRNPLTRSNTSYKSGMLIRTKENDYVPSVALNDSEAEEAVKIEALLQPNVYAVKCQPFKIKLPGGKGEPQEHSFDVGIELDCGMRKLVYVRGEISLNSRSSHSRIADIVRHTPKHAAHEIVVISDASFSRVYRDNNRRILMCHEMPNAEADQDVVNLVNAASSETRVEDIVSLSSFPEDVAWQALMRMIGAGRIGAERDFVIDYPSLIWGNF